MQMIAMQRSNTEFGYFLFCTRNVVRRGRSVFHVGLCQHTKVSDNGYHRANKHFKPNVSPITTTVSSYMKKKKNCIVFKMNISVGTLANVFLLFYFLS